MAFGDLFWHAVNFLAVPLLFAVAAALAARAVWRRGLAGASIVKLVAACAVAAVAAQTAGLVALGGDGRMLTYAAMVVAVALTLGWWLRRR